eukprot:evm.model.NODE_22250_length_37452_cov_20.338779.2
MSSSSSSSSSTFSPQHKRARVVSFSTITSSSPPPATLDDGNFRQALTCQVRESLHAAFGADAEGADAMVTPATRPEFGDYQCNAALALAKRLKAKPREVAEKLKEELERRTQGWCEPLEIAGPGFINVKIKNAFVEQILNGMLSDTSGRLGVARPKKPQRVVVDFSSPNIAKEMHVGHLRSTVIGDTVARVLEFLGHDVMRLNHVGDWGTQFGMLITHLKEAHPEVLAEEGNSETGIGDLVEFYKAAKVRFDQDEGFKLKSRQEVVNLQGGKEETLKAWKTLCALSRGEFQKIYDALGVRLEERGESFYNPMLGEVISDLEKSGLLVESEGARVVFLDGYVTREGERQPFIVQKTDGGFLYATTDLAAARHRAVEEKAERILYVTDAGQASHFDQVFQVARQAKLVPDNVQLKHVPFGLVQGEDGKKFKTRAGDTVKLKDLLDEAVRIARDDLIKRAEEGGHLPPDDLEQSAKTIGLGAVKYADLSLNRESDYKFSYKKMLSLSGNTAPYMLYAYARIQSILRKDMGGEDAGEAAAAGTTTTQVMLQEPAELNLARQLIKLTELLQRVEAELYPHVLCEYMYDISQKFNQFYESCPVNTAPTPELVQSRRTLCALTAQVLRLCLDLLGIEVLQRM